ncbi:MAG: Fur family ferric uptake transcriptional regulator [Kiritimatiellia bacterium]|jgi:Fur family ferric uptake transcriptional regulator
MERKTKQRDAIWNAILHAARPLSPQEVHEIASADIAQLGIATVYRTIKAFLEKGQLAQVDLPGQPPRYEKAGLKHHHHFHCRQCDRVYEMEGCAGNISALAPDDFVVEGHALSLFGLCAACQGAD